MNPLIVSRGRRVAWASLVVVLLLVAAFLLLAWRPAIASVSPPLAASFAAEQVRQGEMLAAVGNCQGCHTPQGGPPFSGGVPLPTPFGTIYGSNITPDAETGIGSWSLPAFRRALHEGVGREGEHLYPALPYDHFTHLADTDIESLYAYFMTREAVRSTPPDDELVFPLQFRPLLAGWKLLFFREGRPEDAASRPRGDYLVDALGHCGACHSPRNALGAEKRSVDAAFSGGEAEGWYAPALDARSPSPVPWTVDALEHYLRTGIAEDHAMSGGPMQAVTHELGWASPADVRAIAESVVKMMGAPTAGKLAVEGESRRRAAAGPLGRSASRSDARPGGAATDVDASTLALGAGVYVGACAACHDVGRGVSSNAALQLPLAVAVHDPDPRSLIRIVKLGILPSDGEARRFMPAFADSLTDEQLTALLTFLRRQAAGAPPWPELARAVREAHGKMATDARLSDSR